jgi:DNA-damage-inducible protein J
MTMGPGMPATTMVHVRVDEQTKIQAAEALADMGLSLSDAVRVFLRRVAVEKALPFSLRAPNAETRIAIGEAEEIIARRNARFTDAEQLFADLETNAGK